MRGATAARRILNDSMSPTAFGARSSAVSVSNCFFRLFASTPDLIRCSKIRTCDSRAVKRATKKARAASASPAAYWPTWRSTPLSVTNTLLSESTRPKELDKVFPMFESQGLFYGHRGERDFRFGFAIARAICGSLGCQSADNVKTLCDFAKYGVAAGSVRT